MTYMIDMDGNDSDSGSDSGSDYPIIIVIIISGISYCCFKKSLVRY